MLDPQIVVKLLAELCVSMNIVRCKRCVVEIPDCQAGRLSDLILRVTALCSETEEFHKQPFGWVDFKSTRTPKGVLTHNLDSAACISRVRLSSYIQRTSASPYLFRRRSAEIPESHTMDNARPLQLKPAW